MQAKRDENRVPTLLAVSSADGTTPVVLYADPTTHRLYVDLPGGSEGTVTTVSVVTANGISGTVANATTTPAITLTLGAITPSSVTVGAGTVATPSLSVGTGGLYSVGPGIVSITNGVSGTAWNGTAFYPNTTNIRDLGISGTNVWANVYATTFTGALNGNAATVTTNANLTGPVTSTGNATAIADAALSIAKTSGLQTALDAKLALAGGTMTGDITLGENTSIALDPAGSADGKYTGITVTGTAGATLAFGDLIYLAVADSRWELADADASATAGPVMMGMCVLAAASDGSATKILLQGIIRADTKFPTMTVGATQFVGETAGVIQGTIPTGADNVIRTVGYALTADELYFNPSTDWQITVA